MDKENKFNKIAYNAEYTKKAYTSFTIRVKPNIASIIDDYIKAHDLSRNELFVKSVLYVITHSIDL